MKNDIHPENLRPVIFIDNASEERFLVLSTVETEETGTWDDGKEYDQYRVEISSASHPFYTGTEKVIDTAGRVDKFERRRQAAQQKQQQKTPQKQTVAEEVEE